MDCDQGSDTIDTLDTFKRAIALNPCQIVIPSLPKILSHLRRNSRLSVPWQSSHFLYYLPKPFSLFPSASIRRVSVSAYTSTEMKLHLPWNNDGYLPSKSRQ
jgi:hypothetical protein